MTFIKKNAVEGMSALPISVAAFPAGIYYYTVSSATGNKVGKFVKQ